MYEQALIGKKIIGKNTKDEEAEFEMLLNEIPHATSTPNLHHLYHHHHHHHHDNHLNLVNGSSCTPHRIDDGVFDSIPSSNYYQYTCGSPVSGFSLQSDGGSSSSLFSSGQCFSDIGSPTPPPFEDLKSPMSCSRTPHYINGFRLDSKVLNSPAERKVNETLIDELGLSRRFGSMCISNNEGQDSYNLREFLAHPNGIRYWNCSPASSNQISVDGYGGSRNLRKCVSDSGVGVRKSFGHRSPIGYNGELNSALLALQQEMRGANTLVSHDSPVLAHLNSCSSPLNSPWQRSNEMASNYCHRDSPAAKIATTLTWSSLSDDVIYGMRNGLNLNEERGVLNPLNFPQWPYSRGHGGMDKMLELRSLQMSNGRTKASPKVRMHHGGLEGFMNEDSFVLQGEDVKDVNGKGPDQSMNLSKSYVCGMPMDGYQVTRSHLDVRPLVTANDESARNLRLDCSFALPINYNSLVEARGKIRLLAKDQHGCRFLQRMFDEGTVQDVQIIFSEIVDHIVELMMNPFGNYLIQKLLDVCTEEQRMHILLGVTATPGELVRISLNAHGTRVVQKLIETLKTRQQILLVVSALEPGFLALIKDLNGNHVVQRCLQCLSNEDNKFIFIAAANHCVDIATHQHGCCVLQRCIRHSTGEHRDKLIAEISANGLRLAQDAFGNYVVQFILELKIPFATSSLISQFEGHYVHLATQKFSSHVVEKCLAVLNDEDRSRIISELLSTQHFEQLLQDPHANYVIQTALKVSEGHIHNTLVEVIESHKAVSRNSPYSKKIFSQKLLKK
ncbi:Pumilio RNA-binding repeat [Dillenia turbinata]|uniref:Pumilio RNA-binding repeat n=1 Tax=Dillenia turbinata TaxID=194707 RepID=A0AAN8ZPV8_9MAGN